MNTVFNFMNGDELYRKCIFASIAHAVMVGKYDLLIDEISWDGNNYLFQNMEGTRGVFSFSDMMVVCGLLNEAQYIMGLSLIFEKLIDSTDDELTSIVKEEILPYFFVDDNGRPGLTALFWSRNENFFSLSSEEGIMKNSSSILLPYLYELDDAKKYWRDYYEADEEQMNLVNFLFEKKMLSSSFSLDEDIVKKLVGWFGEKHILCRQALAEIGIR